MSPRFRISTLSMLSWLPKSSVQLGGMIVCLLFELSPNHVCEYFKSLVRVKAEAIMCLDPVLVDDSQTSEGFESIPEVFSAFPTRFSTPTPRNGSLVYRYARRHGERIQSLEPVGRLSSSTFAVLSKLDFGHDG
jgi:hypothetical protein